MGRNVPGFDQDPPIGGRHCHSKENTSTPHLETTKRNPISKDIGNKRSGGRFQGQTERPAERFVLIVPARSGSVVYLGWGSDR